jgi:hypothetical protein
LINFGSENKLLRLNGSKKRELTLLIFGCGTTEIGNEEKSMNFS